VPLGQTFLCGLEWPQIKRAQTLRLAARPRPATVRPPALEARASARAWLSSKMTVRTPPEFPLDAAPPSGRVARRPLESPMETQSDLESRVKSRVLPRHLGLIMDGNGRWAESRGLPRLEGHREGSTSVQEVTRAARRVGLSAVTLYAFSAQNWARPADEVAGLMDLLREYLLKERRELLDNDIRLEAIGELEKLPRYVREPLEALRADSRDNRSMVLTLALSYGGREELVAMVRRVAEKAARGELEPSAVSEALVDATLWTAGLPPVDLVIRTSGERRLSNFLLWQSAYAELLFVDTAWPDFRGRELCECLLAFQDRERRFGKTGAQARTASVATIRRAGT
jgi:undecaprenyl diphosphate synthase